MAIHICNVHSDNDEDTVAGCVSASAGVLLFAGSMGKGGMMTVAWRRVMGGDRVVDKLISVADSTGSQWKTLLHEERAGKSMMGLM